MQQPKPFPKKNIRKSCPRVYPSNVFADLMLGKDLRIPDFADFPDTPEGIEGRRLWGGPIVAKKIWDEMCRRLGNEDLFMEGYKVFMGILALVEGKPAQRMSKRDLIQLLKQLPNGQLQQIVASKRGLLEAENLSARSAAPPPVSPGRSTRTIDA